MSDAFDRRAVPQGRYADRGDAARSPMSEWEDMIVGDRMTVDNEFTDRVQASQFSNQEWGLIMTATELDFEAADDPEAAPTPDC